MNIILYSIFLGGCELTSYLGVDLLLPFVKQLSYEIYAPDWWRFLVFQIWVIALGCFSLITALLNKSISKSLNMLFGTICFFTGCLLLVISKQPMLLLLGRLLQGISTSCVLVTGFAFLHENLNDIKAIHIISWLKSFVIMPTVLAPVIGKTWVSFGFKWQSLMFINLLVGTVSFCAVTFFLLKADGHNFFKIKKPDPIKKTIKMICRWSFFSNVFTQDLFESVVFLWITFAPLYCDDFVFYHTLALGSALIGMRATDFLIKHISSTKIISIFLSISIISLVFGIAYQALLIQGSGWCHMTLPLIFYFFTYGIEGPILDRAVAASVEDIDKTITLGMTFFIHYAMYSSWIGLSCYLNFYDSKNFLIISLSCVILSCITNVYRKNTLDV